MKTGILAGIVLALCLALTSCGRSDVDYYLLEGGDPQIDWVGFCRDSVLLWMGPGMVPESSRYEVRPDGVIVVHISPFSDTHFVRLDARTLEGEVPFFEGTWKKKRHIK